MTTTNLEITRGDTFVRSLAIVDASGDAYDLTGATVWLTVKQSNDRNAGDDEAPIRLYWESGGGSDGISVADAIAGTCLVEIVPGRTDGLAPGVGRYRYDVQVKKLTRVDTPISGQITVWPDVTRRTSTP